MGAGGSTSPVVMIQDPDTGLRADVVQLGDGSQALRTSGIVQIEQLFGQDGFPDTWFALGEFGDCAGIGAEGDTIQVLIAAGCDPTEYPAVDVTYTITAGDVAAVRPEIETRNNIISFLNGTPAFSAQWRANKVKDNGIIHITSKYRAEVGERLILNDFQVITTGTTWVTVAFNTIERRGKGTSLSRDPADPRVGILGISGTVSVTAGAVDNIYQEDIFEVTDPGNNNMAVDGFPTPIEFGLNALDGYDLFVEEIRFHGEVGSVKYGQFLNINQKLSNGIIVTIKSDDGTTTFQPIKATDDFKARWSSLGGFDLDVQAGGDHFLATRKFDATALPVLRATGTYIVDDYIDVSIQNDIDSIGELYCTVIGFRKEP